MGPIVDPARERGEVPVAERPADDVMRESVDLEEVDAWNVRVKPAGVTSRHSLQHVAVVEVIVVDREQRGRERVHQRHADRDGDACAQIADVHGRLEARDD